MEGTTTLWSQDDMGFYWLMFPNRAALSMDEIRAIFSQFGSLKNVTRAGDDRGLRFVQFFTLESTMRAVESLAEHPTITLKPHRQHKKKGKQNNNKNGEISNEDNNSTNASNNEHDYKKNLFKRNKSESNYFTIPSSNDTVSPPRGLLNFLDDNDDCNTESEHSGKTDEQSFSKNMSPIFSKTNCERVLSNGLNTKNDNVSTETSTHMKKTTDPSRSTFNGRCNNCNKDNDNIQLPDLIIKENSLPDKLKKKNILDAGEIIVGNIDKNYGVGYVLHLLENYDPIAISYIKQVPETGIRYCHVYFKNIQDSINVEKQFDMLKLKKNNLIVMRPCKLLEEAKI